MKCLIVVCQRTVIIAIGAPSVSAAVVSGCIFRIQLDRPIVVGNGAVVVAFVLPGATSKSEGFGKFRVKIDRLQKSAMARSLSPLSFQTLPRLT